MRNLEPRKNVLFITKHPIYNNVYLVSSLISSQVCVKLGFHCKLISTLQLNVTCERCKPTS